MQLTSCERHSFDSNLGTIWSHRGAIPFHAIVLINNPPQDVIQTRIQQYSFLKNTAILTCFSCPAALLLFSGKRLPRRQALWPLCSALLSWLKPQGSLYLVMHSLSQNFGAVCDSLFIYSGYFISTFQPVLVFEKRIYDFGEFLDSSIMTAPPLLPLLFACLIFVEEKIPKKNIFKVVIINHLLVAR